MEPSSNILYIFAYVVQQDTEHQFNMPLVIIMFIVSIFCFVFSVIFQQKVLKVPEDQSYGISGITTLFIYMVISQLLLYNKDVTLICAQECHDMIRFLMPRALKNDVTKVSQLFVAQQQFPLNITNTTINIRIFLMIIAFSMLLVIKFHKVKTVNQIIDPIERQCGNIPSYVQYFTLKKAFPLTYKMKLLYSTLLRVYCEFCEIDLPYTTHYSDGQQRYCIFDYDHVCYWVNQKIYRHSMGKFYLFLISMLAFFGIIMLQFIARILNLMFSIKSQYQISLFRTVFPIIMMGDSKISLELVTFIISLIIFIVALIQFIEQTRNMFSVFSKDDRKYLLDLCNQMKQGIYDKKIKLSQKTLQYNSQQYKYDVYELIDEKNGSQNTDEIDLNVLRKNIERDVRSWSLSKVIELLVH